MNCWVMSSFIWIVVSVENIEKNSIFVTFFNEWYYTEIKRTVDAVVHSSTQKPFPHHFDCEVGTRWWAEARTQAISGLDGWSTYPKQLNQENVSRIFSIVYCSCRRYHTIMYLSLAVWYLAKGLHSPPEMRHAAQSVPKLKIHWCTFNFGN